MTASSDIAILRDLVLRYNDVCRRPEENEKRDLWRHQNSFEDVPRVPIYARAFAWAEMPQRECFCEDRLMRSVEHGLRNTLFRATLGDDYVFEPWLRIGAAVITPPNGLWGVPVKWTRPEGDRKTCGIWDPPIKDLDDLSALATPEHRINEDATAERAARVRDAVGDLIDVVVDRAPAYRIWGGDISTHLAYLRGAEQIMWDMVDNPDGLHRLLTHMRDGILRTHEQAEEAGDWRLVDHENQAMAYARELQDPDVDPAPVTRRDLWYFCASQETTGIGPHHFDEFMYSYQIPIMAPFGLVAYGCCEDLTHKIDVLRKLPNLRRIAVTPFANVASCVDQIGRDYVISYRPNPSSMVSSGLSDDTVRELLRADLEVLKGTQFDITLKDVETVLNDPDRVRNWVALTRDVCEDVLG